MSWVEWINDRATAFCLGATTLLIMGLVATLMTREPLLRLRRSTYCVVAVLLFGGLTWIPRPEFVQTLVASRQADGDSASADDGRGDDDRTARDSTPGDEPAGGSRMDHFAVPTGLPTPTSNQPPSPARPSVAPVARPPAPTEPAPRPSRLWLTLWLAGAAATASWLAIGTLRLRLLLKRARTIDNRQLPIVLPRDVRVAVVDSATPFCCGWIRPTIVLPSELLAPDQRGVLRAVLAHEAAHLERRDPIARALLAVAIPFLWFHPALHCLRAIARRASENLADQVAVASLELPPTDYARQLLRLSESGSAAVPSGAIAVIQSRSELRKRIEMLLNSDHSPALRSPRPMIIRLATGVVLIATWLTFATAPSTAQEKPSVNTQLPDVKSEDGSLTGLETEPVEAKSDLQRFLASPSLHNLSPVELELLMRAIEKTAGVANAQGSDPVDVTVKAGDSLMKIHRRLFGANASKLDVTAFSKLNPNASPRELRVGQKLRFPRPSPNGSSPLLGAGKPSASKPSQNSRRYGVNEIADLLSRKIDAETEFELATRRIPLLKSRSDAGRVSKENLAEAEIRADAAAKKVALIKDVIALQFAAVQDDLTHAVRSQERLTKLHENGMVTAAELQLVTQEARRLERLSELLRR